MTAFPDTLRPEHELATLTLGQVAALYGVSKNTIRARMRRGMPYVVTPASNRPRFSLAQIARWERQFTGNPAPEEPLMDAVKVLKIIGAVRPGRR